MNLIYTRKVASTETRTGSTRTVPKVFLIPVSPLNGRPEGQSQKFAPLGAGTLDMVSYYCPSSGRPSLRPDGVPTDYILNFCLPELQLLNNI